MRITGTIFRISGFLSCASAAMLFTTTPITSALAQGAGSFTAGQLLQTSQMPDLIPFSVENGLIIVKAVVGDGLAESAIIDTGLPTCFIGPEYAAKRAMKPTGLRDAQILDRSVRVVGVPVQSVRINRVVISTVAFNMFDLFKHLSATPPKDAPLVWIGSSALAALSLTIDPQLQRLMLRPAGAPLPPNSTVVPFELKDGRIWIDVKVNGKKSFSALVDTGSVGTLLPASVAKALTLIPAATMPITHPDGKEGKVSAVELADLAIGGLKVTDVQAIYIEQGSKDGFDPEFGIIGNDVLLRYRITIDYAQKKIAFEKLAAPKTDQKIAGPIGNANPAAQLPRLAPGGARIPPVKTGGQN